jgi:hypothetical protein
MQDTYTYQIKLYGQKNDTTAVISGAGISPTQMNGTSPGTILISAYTPLGKYTVTACDSSAVITKYTINGSITTLSVPTNSCQLDLTGYPSPVSISINVRAEDPNISFTRYAQLKNKNDDTALNYQIRGNLTDGDDNVHGLNRVQTHYLSQETVGKGIVLKNSSDKKLYLTTDTVKNTTIIYYQINSNPYIFALSRSATIDLKSNLLGTIPVTVSVLVNAEDGSISTKYIFTVRLASTDTSLNAAFVAGSTTISSVLLSQSNPSQTLSVDSHNGKQTAQFDIDSMGQLNLNALYNTSVNPSYMTAQISNISGSTGINATPQSPAYQLTLVRKNSQSETFIISVVAEDASYTTTYNLKVQWIYDTPTITILNKSDYIGTKTDVSGNLGRWQPDTDVSARFGDNNITSVPEALAYNVNTGIVVKCQISEKDIRQSLSGFVILTGSGGFGNLSVPLSFNMINGPTSITTKQYDGISLLHI